MPEPLVVPSVVASQPVSQTDPIAQSNVATDLKISQQEALAKLRLQRQMNVPITADNLREEQVYQPTEFARTTLSKWSGKSALHAASLFGDDELHWNQAQVDFADAESKKYKPFEEETLLGSFASGYEDADLSRMRALRPLMNNDQTYAYEAQEQEFRKSQGKIGSGDLINTIPNSLGYLVNTVVKGGSKGAAVGTAVGAAGVVGGPLAGLTIPAGFFTGLGAGVTGDMALTAIGAQLRELDQVPELQDSNALKYAVATPIGLAVGALDRFGLGIGKVGVAPGLKRLTEYIAKDTNFLTLLAKHSVAEGATESAQESLTVLGNWVTQKLYSGDIAPEHRAELASVENLIRVARAGYSGAFVGGALSIPHAALINATRGQDATELVNQTIAAQNSVSKTAASKQTPEIAHEIAHTLDLHQTVYLDPDAVDKIDPATLARLGVKPSELIAARQVGQYAEISTTSLMTLENHDQFAAVAPFLRKDKAGEAPDLDRLNLNVPAEVKKAGADALKAERDLVKSEVMQAMEAASDADLQRKLAFDFAKKTKEADIAKILDENVDLKNKIVFTSGLAPKEYARGVVNTWANMAQYVADSTMTATDWMNALTVEHIGRVAGPVGVQGRYRTNSIALTKISDGSTLLHEGAHHFLQMWMGAGVDGKLDSVRKEELDALTTWAGTDLKEVMSNDAAYSKFHEKVASAVEQRFREGRLPDSFSGKLKDIVERIVSMFGRIYANAKGKLGGEVPPNVDAILGRWLFGENKAEIAIARASLWPEQVDKAIKQLGLSEAEAELKKTNLAKAVERARTTFNRQNAQEVAEARRSIVEEESGIAQEKLGRVAISTAQMNPLNAFEVRTSYGTDTLKALDDRGMIAKGSDGSTVSELIEGAGYTQEQFADQLMNPGGQYAVEMMETIRFVKETGGFREGTIDQFFTGKDAETLKSIVKSATSVENVTPKNPYKYDTELYSAHNGGDPATWTRTILVDQYKKRFDNVHKKATEALLNGMERALTGTDAKVTSRKLNLPPDAQKLVDDANLTDAEFAKLAKGLGDWDAFADPLGAAGNIRDVLNIIRNPRKPKAGNPKADVSNFNKLIRRLDTKKRAVDKLDVDFTDSYANYQIGAKRSMISLKDVDFLREMASKSELAEVKDLLNDEADAIQHAIAGLGTAVVKRADITAILNMMLDTDRNMREVYKVGDWWNQQWFTRWIQGKANPINEAADISRMPEVWRSYFNLLDDMEAGRTEGLRDAMVRRLVPPQIRNQIPEILAPAMATGSLEFGSRRPTQSFDQLSGETVKVEEALTSEQQDAETRRQLLAVAMIPRDVRNVMLEFHKYGISEEALSVLPAQVQSLLRELNIVRPDGIKPEGYTSSAGGASINEWVKSVKTFVEKNDLITPPITSPDVVLLDALDTPPTIAKQIQDRVNARMAEFLSQDTDAKVLREVGFWQHLKDMGDALYAVAGVKTDVASAKTPVEKYILDARNELAEMPMQIATDSKRAFGDFVRSQKISIRALVKGEFRRALIAHNNGLRNYQRALQAQSLADLLESQQKRAKVLRRVQAGKLDRQFQGAYLMLAQQVGIIPSAPKWAQSVMPGAVLEKHNFPEMHRIAQMLQVGNLHYSKMSAGDFVLIDEALRMLDRAALVNSEFKTVKLASRTEDMSPIDIARGAVADLKDYTPAKSTLLSYFGKFKIGEKFGGIIGDLDREVTNIDYIFEALNKFRNATGKGVRGIVTVIADEFRMASRQHSAYVEKSIPEIDRALGEFVKNSGDMPKVNRELPGGKYGVEWTPETVFAFCAQYGNEYQRTALLEGYGLTEADAQKILDALPESGWTAIDKVIETMGRLKDPLFEARYQVEGVYPNEEVALPFLAGGKERKGGHVPLYYDYSLMPKDITKEYKDFSIDSHAAIFPANASTGREIARRSSGGRPPLLTTEIFGRGIRDMAHYAAYAQPVSLYNSVMMADSGALRKEAVRVIGEDGMSLLDEHIQTYDPKSAAHFRADTKMNKFLANKLRPTATVSALAFNTASAIKSHLSQYPLSMSQVGFTHYMKGLTHFVTNPAMRKFAAENSPSLKRALSVWETEGNYTATSLAKYGTTKKFFRAIKPAMMAMHMLADMPHRYSTWIGAYISNAGLPETERILAADRAVDSAMPSGDAITNFRLRYNEKGALHFFSSFMVQASAAHNRFKVQYNGWQEGQLSNAEFARYVVIERMASPLLWASTIPLLGYAASGGDDEWLDKLEADRLAIELAGYQFSGLPVARELVAYSGRKYLGDPASLRPTSLSFAESVLTQAGHAAVGWNEDPQRAAMSSAALLAMTWGLPINGFYERMRSAMEKNNDELAEALFLGKP